MAKAKRSIAEASSELFNLLEPFEPAERTRIVVGTLTLLGDPVPAQVSSQGGGGGTSGTDSGRTPAPPAATGGARAYLDGKAPKGTSELLATAARFHELNNAGAAPTKESFAAIIHT